MRTTSIGDIGERAAPAVTPAGGRPGPTRRPAAARRGRPGGLGNRTPSRAYRELRVASSPSTRHPVRSDSPRAGWVDTLAQGRPVRPGGHRRAVVDAPATAYRGRHGPIEVRPARREGRFEAPRRLDHHPQPEGAGARPGDPPPARRRPPPQALGWRRRPDGCTPGPLAGRVCFVPGLLASLPNLLPLHCAQSYGEVDYGG